MVLSIYAPASRYVHMEMNKSMSEECRSFLQRTVGGCNAKVLPPEAEVGLHAGRLGRERLLRLRQLCNLPARQAYAAHIRHLKHPH